MRTRPPRRGTAGPRSLRRQPELVPQRIAADSRPLRILTVSRGNGVADAGLRQPKYRLLQRFQIVVDMSTAAGRPCFVIVMMSCVASASSTSAESLSLASPSGIDRMYAL